VSAIAKGLNWNLLHMFGVLAEQGSVSRAAGVLGRGQPAVSAALKKLEDQLGCRLATRTARTFALTDAGQVLYREAREIAGSVDRLPMLLADRGGELAGSVRVTIGSHMTSPVIDRAFSEFHRRHPKATFDITVSTSPDIADALANNLITFGIGPVHRLRDDFTYFHIFREHCGFYCGPGHSLFGERGLTTRDLENERAVTYKAVTFSNALQTIANMHQAVGFADPLVGISNHLEEVRRMILSGLGIGAIPIHIAERDVREGLLWRLPPYEPTMPIDVYLFTSPRARPTRTEQAFIDVLVEVVSSITPAERTYPRLDDAQQRPGTRKEGKRLPGRSKPRSGR
jgi:DNA-binding transcriptional LysR family regulator